MSIYTIYKATNRITGKSYIGYSSDWKSRKRLHKYHAKQDDRNYLFYNSIRKHGFESFIWEIIYQSKDKLHTLGKMESYFIVEYNTLSPNGYNMKTGGEGGNLSEESRKKISESRKGMKFSEEHINNLRLSHQGNKHTEEQKKKISESLKGKEKILKLVICPHCNLVGKGSNMTRYHFNNCKKMLTNSY
jgi:group I intron endonuclease